MSDAERFALLVVVWLLTPWWACHYGLHEGAPCPDCDHHRAPRESGGAAVTWDRDATARAIAATVWERCKRKMRRSALQPPLHDGPKLRARRRARLERRSAENIARQNVRRALHAARVAAERDRAAGSRMQ